MKKHTFEQFDVELESLQKRVLMLGEVVCQQVLRAMDGLANNDIDLIEDVIKTDKAINREEVALDEQCIEMIARHAPTANDLRLIMSVMQMGTDLERVGDEAKKIAKAARLIVESESAFVPKVELHYVSEMAVGMLRSALDAFVRRDPTASAQILRQDKEVDAIFKGIVRQLATFMMEDPRLITRSLDVLFIAKSIERVGDHATNVAELVVYMVKGRDVRHDSIEDVERQARGQ
ncbi:phosphate signaling complex protein PhoU [Rhodocyclaceae bacterium SMB388]